MNVADDASIQLNVGSVETFNGKFSLHYVVPESGQAVIQMVATDAGGKSVSLILGAKQYQDIKDLIAKTDRTIARFHNEDKREDTRFVRVPGTMFPIPAEAYDRIVALVVEGKTMLAAAEICRVVPSVDLFEARQAAVAIYEYVARTGQRE